METNNKDWNQPGTWAEELVEQAKEERKEAERRDYRHLTMFKMSFGLNVLLVIIIAILAMYCIRQSSNYDLIYQDGNGQNNYNNDVGGDVNNVSTGQEEEGRQE